MEYAEKHLRLSEQPETIAEVEAIQRRMEEDAAGQPWARQSLPYNITISPADAAAIGEALRYINTIPPEVVAAVKGLESSYGTILADTEQQLGPAYLQTMANLMQQMRPAGAIFLQSSQPKAEPGQLEEPAEEQQQVDGRDDESGDRT